MPLHPIQAGLHRLKNDSADVAKVDLRIPAGAEVEVPEDVAAQLVAQGNFRDPETVPEPAPQVVKDADGQPIGMTDGSDVPVEIHEMLGTKLPAGDTSESGDPEPAKKVLAKKVPARKKPTAG